MSSGMPDYLRTIRPRYGTAMKSAGSKVAAAIGDTTLLSVTGKGIIYGGIVYSTGTATQKNSIIQLEIDGVQMISMSFNDMDALNIDICGIFPTVLIKFDDAGFKYAVGLCRGVTFESSLKIIYTSLNVTDAFVFSWLMYSAL